MRTPILVVECNEPNKTVVRSVRPFVLDKDSGARLWQEASKFPRIFNNVDTSSAPEFLDAFFKWDEVRQEAVTDSLLWVVDDFVGIFSLTNIYHPDDALMHFTFFDKRFRGRAELIREMIKYVFLTYGFHRLSAEIPAYASKGVLKFITEAVGLFPEGRKRKAIPFHDERADLLLYGIAKEDIDSWEAQKQKPSEEERQPQ
jgi:RimJ/RimL family protein N-acetyltransferase